MSTVLVKHDLHTSCAQGIVTGSTTMLRHTGHVTSDSVNDDSLLLLPLPLSGEEDNSRLRRGAIRPAVRRCRSSVHATVFSG